MIRLAVYGKGGIGKSTTACNLSAALSEMGLRVMQVGCDPKSDSTGLLMGGEKIETVLDLMRSGKEPCLSGLVHTGFNGVLCVEAGGPTPGIGCAGHGIITAFDTLKKLHAFDEYRPDAVIYDVLGDVVCGGFAMPMRGQYSDRVYIVTSGEKMSLFAAENIAAAISNFKLRGYARLGGLILNRRNCKNEESLVSALAEKTGTDIIADLPRSETVQQAEELEKTVIEAFPDSEMARSYRALAKKIAEEA